LGRCWGAPATIKKACGYFVTGDQRGDPMATETLADCYFHGDGMDKKLRKVRAALLLQSCRQRASRVVIARWATNIWMVLA